MRSCARAYVGVSGIIVALALAGCGEDAQGGDVAAGDTAVVDTGPDVIAFDTVASDTAAPVTDTVGADVAPGEFGSSCNTNADCLGGYCVEGPEGFVCTTECRETCPDGYDCKGIANQTDVVFLCVPRFLRVCTPCLDDLQCSSGACLTLDGRRSCAVACSAPEDCPEGYVCGGDPEGQRTGTYCQPESGSCTCNVDFDGGLRTCLGENALGTCYGVQACDPLVGWGECSVGGPTAEQCNGVDDDCNGLIDDAVPGDGDACVVSAPGIGECPGTRRCVGADGFTCQGPTPVAETCDFQDNDCDGAVDEDFKTGAEYTAFEHCGTCNNSCANGFPGAQLTQCQTSGGVPQCVVVLCEQGYIKLNDFQCIPEVANLCQACSTDANCVGQDSYCNTLSDGDFCGKGCVSGTDCPDGFACQNVGRPVKQCVPTTNVCSCGPGTLGLSRSCSVTVSPAGQPSYTCAGNETCSASGWGACALPSEECDGFDNDCDGTIDETFRDAQGRYDRVEHCGGCGISCLALSFQNASPVCDKSGGGAPQCSFACNGNWVDVDGLPGCECLPTSTTDLPDPMGVDADCDGIDGEVDKGVFVAKTGDDGAPGTIEAPVRTIQRGIDLAKAQGKRDVYVATGVYVQSIGLEAGVSVYGGYSPPFTERDIDVHETAIIGEAPTAAKRGAVNAVSVGSSAANIVRFDGFSVFGASNPTAGGTSYAIYLRDAGPQTFITRNLVIAGDGGAGTAGDDGTNGGSGASGASGRASCFLSGPSFSCSLSGGALLGGNGGTNGSCSGTSGGKGGNALEPNVPVPANVGTATQTPNAQEHGVGGAGPAGDGGEAGWHGTIGRTSCGICSSPTSHPVDGGVGQDGGPGSNGAPAAACANGGGAVNASGVWQPHSGSAGNTGAHGGGGGGGGAAGGVDDATCTNGSCTGSGSDCVPVYGGSGGGGGAGGCGASGGAAGGGGGGSFGIFASWSSGPASLPTITDNIVYRGRGGVGGAGGAGGVGGGGGSGGAGGISGSGLGSNLFPLNPCGSSGGFGGNGGSGGHGSGGAGGCGGASYGVYLSYSGSPSLSSVQGNTVPASGAGGSGGGGGFSLGTRGPDGVTGSGGAKNY